MRSSFWLCTCQTDQPKASPKREKLIQKKESKILYVQGTCAKIIETRKTVPGLRVLDKWAVLIGGGSNHRMGLFDMLMVKDNHVTAAGGITNAVAKCQVQNQQPT